MRHICLFLRAGWTPLLALFLTLPTLSSLSHAARSNYVEPGSLRLSHTLSLEGVFQKLRPGWKALRASPTDLNNTYTVDGNNERPWKSEWGQTLLTEVATRLSPDVSARVLLEAQGEYADRFFRPLNINHDLDDENENFFFREAEGRIDKDAWYLHGFSGVAKGNWEGKGDFMGLYPAAIPGRDYLGSSGFFGVHPENWGQDQYLNITHRSIPRGAEAGATWKGVKGTVAYGDELSWGYRESFYGNAQIPMWGSWLTFTYKDEDVPHSLFDEDERNRAYALSWYKDFKAGHRVDVGVLYNPFRVGDQYRVRRDVPAGAGLLGSSHLIHEKTAIKEDALGGRVRMEHYATLFEKLWILSLDLEHRGVLAGNREAVQLGVNTEIFGALKGDIQYTVQRPLEGPLPFLFEGSPDNIGAVASNPRGPESPFTVDWENREAAFLLATLQYDPTPGSSFLIYDQRALSLWNINPDEDSPAAFACQYRMSDYKTATDRQYYFNEQGKVTWEDAAHSGAWATDHPLHEVRFLSQGDLGPWRWTLGVAGGQMAAGLGLAYSNDTTKEKPITEYFSVEGRMDRWPLGFWWHYGSGLWGPEENIHPAFGLSWDRLWGVGVSYNITVNTTWDLGYLAARQDDNLFTAPDLGSFDEIRTVFSHRFGFLFHFQEPARSGYQAR